MIKKLNKNKTLCGKTVLITGTTSGIGLACTKHLAKLGTTIISCSRNTALAESQLNTLKTRHPDLKFSVYHLDLQNLKTMDSLLKKLKEDFPDGIDYVINNAGIFARPKKKTPYGYEQHFFTNCLSPIYFTKKLEPLLTKNSRVIFVSSISIKNARVNFEEIDLYSIKNNIRVYANSKLWLTNYVLYQNKFSQGNKNKYFIIQPGVCSSSLMSSKNGSFSKFISGLCNVGMKILFHSTSKAALCEIAGLTYNIEDSEWIGPKFWGIWGKPKAQKLQPKNANDEILSKCYKTIENIINKF